LLLAIYSHVVSLFFRLIITLSYPLFLALLPVPCRKRHVCFSLAPVSFPVILGNTIALERRLPCRHYPYTMCFKPPFLRLWPRPFSLAASHSFSPTSPLFCGSRRVRFSVVFPFNPPSLQPCQFYYFCFSPFSFCSMFCRFFRAHTAPVSSSLYSLSPVFLEIYAILRTPRNPPNFFPLWLFWLLLFCPLLLWRLAFSS